VERIACWNARRRNAVIGAWLLLGVTLLAGQLSFIDVKMLGVGWPSRCCSTPRRYFRLSISE